MKKLSVISLILVMAILTLAACGNSTPTASGSASSGGSSSSAVSSEPSGSDDASTGSASVGDAAFPVGSYADTDGAALEIQQNGETYSVKCEIYNLATIQDDAATYDAATGTLHFEGQDGDNRMAGDITQEGGSLVVTLTQSDFLDCPAGSTFTYNAVA